MSDKRIKIDNGKFELGKQLISHGAPVKLAAQVLGVSVASVQNIRRHDSYDSYRNYIKTYTEAMRQRHKTVLPTSPLAEPESKPNEPAPKLDDLRLNRLIEAVAEMNTKQAQTNVLLNQIARHLSYGNAQLDQIRANTMPRKGFLG